MKLTPSTKILLKRLLVGGRNNRPLRSILAKLNTADLASLLIQLPHGQIPVVIEALLSINHIVDPLLQLPPQKLPKILRILSFDTVLKILIYAPEEDAAYFLSLLEKEESDHYLEKITPPKLGRISQFLRFPEKSAGRMMQTKFAAFPVTLTAAETLNELRGYAKKQQSVYYIYCVEQAPEDSRSTNLHSVGKLMGVLSLRELATADPETKLEALVKKHLIAVDLYTPEDEVAEIVSRYDLVAVPVLDEQSFLVGIITVDDVVDIIQEQVTKKLYAQAGLREGDSLLNPISKNIKSRLPWMFSNLFFAVLASGIVSIFEKTMQELILLATVKNIVVALSGNMAIQTLTITTRGQAVGDFDFITYRQAIFKELITGFVLGILTGLGSGILVYFWKGDALVAIVIGITMVINGAVANGFAIAVPIVLKALKWDPATGSGVIVTTITDIFGFFSFLGIASLGLMLFT